MHQQAREFVAQFATDAPLRVIEIGSRDINGNCRDLFPNADWTGLDLYAGPMVDVVCDAESWRPSEPVDLVICCEVLEHAKRWRGLLAASAHMLKPGGTLIVTCAGTGRRPHSHFDGGKLRAGEYYRNLTPENVARILTENGFRVDVAIANRFDTQVKATRES